ncbi:hypothetical protein B0T21DRAFT_109005 [Apiosordaria backusii]|uniref:Uncharacterized protein n=1 Tax=Apiosordaria backusii TaxID=314023 RepID=A0AA39ZSQ5_9PEZI|nr:hypothetical protein B0T21DRAFT_109005 [Apiosordaria backusii]
MRQQRGSYSQLQDGHAKSQARRGWWWWEIRAVIVTILCILCATIVVAILSRADGLALDAWSMTIQPNALISIFTTLGKSSMMVAITACLGQLKWWHFYTGERPLRNMQICDEASRGLWGAFVFFGRVRSPAYTALLLSLITILALGIEPSTQQVLKFSSREVKLDGVVAELGVANVYVSEGCMLRMSTDKAVNSASFRISGRANADP